MLPHEPAPAGAAFDNGSVAGDLVPSAGPADLAGAVRTASALRGLNAAHARLIHHYSNAVYYLPEPRLVARVTRGADAGPRLTVAQQVAGWLVDHHHFPATAPALGAEPVQVDEQLTVTFWRYYHQPDATAAPTSDHLGRLLSSLHGIADTPSVPLQRWVPLAALHAALINYPVVSEMLRAGERDWLLEEVHRVREELDQLDWPLGWGLIHGDAWAGNLLWDLAAGPDAVVLTDWDWVSYGPREIDLIPTWHAARRYGRGKAWTEAFIARYGHDLSGWAGFPTVMRMRDLVQITGPLSRAKDSEPHRAALRERVEAIRTGDTLNTWRAL